MKILFDKYHALKNDFIVLDAASCRISKRSLPRLAATICDRRSGVGADGLLYLSASRRAECRLDVYNADGGWAEKSGNGLRIAAMHLARGKNKSREFSIETGTSIDTVKLGRKSARGGVVTCELGQPNFETKAVPVRSRRKFVINEPVKVGTVELPMTCLAVGNPHAVLIVENFDFDWPALGAEIEMARAFPNGTNVEFLKPVSRKRLQVREWERGVGVTQSCGTGAAAAVCAMVMLGLADRRCEVEFEAGRLKVEWAADGGIVRVTGPVEHVMNGEFIFR